MKGNSLMHEEIIISGFGGQGSLFAGQLLAYAGMDSGKHVTWIPSYGPEMRGGTAHCTVVISDESIGSPLVRHPSAAIALNAPSLQKYESLVRPGGLLVYNSSLIDRTVYRTDLRVIPVPANDISAEETASLLENETGDIRLANVVTLGALVQATGVLSLDAIESALESHLPQRHQRWLEPNKRALCRGAEVAQLIIA
ncbi:MAG: 2-oxoacid:acceptor oxidoreductase family protein [Chloroflexota bacterium]|nr:2-oxoacid:acceptor oxidoreductase family protein [Chloroflexota bacterium]